jgi:AAA+ ATPase superfamily predicted ATPase
VPARLTNLPPISPEDLVGRAAELAGLADLLDASTRRVLLDGLGGIGKTTLAKAFAQAHAARYRHVLWIEQSGSLVSSLVNHPHLALNLGLSFAEVENESVRFNKITSALMQLSPGPKLLVIDNADESILDGQPAASLPAPPDWQVLVTSRYRLAGFKEFTLNELTPKRRKNSSGGTTAGS